MADDVLKRATAAALTLEATLLVRTARPVIEPSSSLDPDKHGLSPTTSQTSGAFGRLFGRR